MKRLGAGAFALALYLSTVLIGCSQHTASVYVFTATCMAKGRELRHVGSHIVCMKPRKARR